MASGRERLALWIERSKINQAEAAGIIGIDQTQLSKILSGDRTPGLTNAVKIERATGITVDAWVPIADDEDAEPVGANGRKSKLARA